MDKTTAFIVSVVAAFLIGGHLGFFVARDMIAGKDIIRERVDTVYKTTTVQDVRYYPMPELIVLPPLPAVIDTPAVVADYYALKFYRDTLANTKELTAILEDSVTENNIRDRYFRYELRYPEITRVETKRSTISAGVMVDTRQSVSLQAGFKSVFFQAGYNVIDREPFFGFGIKLYER